ncbi:MAG: HIT family protein [Candidatus Nanohaloarchaeota archaeon QJJ-9]|nr:HIT family protein [Candidatus Nanohaloarchaeota archaeon QJJ-9]
MPQRQQCPFCQLLENPEQTFIVHETEKFRAWLDVNPRARGHTVVVPKEHVESYDELGEDFLEMFDVARIAGEKAKSGLGAEGYSIVFNDGEVAGQRISHVYMLVFPRFEGEENEGTPAGAVFRPEELEKSDLEEIHGKMEDASFEDFSKEVKTVYEKAKEGNNTDGERSQEEEKSSQENSNFDSSKRADFV